MADLRLPTVIITALIDSINPCAIGVLILLISTLLSLSDDKKRMIFVGLVYIIAVYVAYFVAGLGLLTILQRLPFDVAQFVGMLVGGLVVLLGFVELKDAFFPRKGRGPILGINPKYSEKIKQMAKKTTVPGVIALGIFVAAVELPCTGGPYLAITALLAQKFDLKALLYLAIYNFIFVLPLIIIVILAYVGTSVQKLKEWQQANKKLMRIGIGLLMVALGVVLILFAADVIKLSY